MPTAPDTLPPMLTLAEAAQRLGVTAGSLRIQAARGRLRAEKVGRDWLVSEAELERYRREHAGRPGRRRKEPGDAVDS